MDSNFQPGDQVFLKASVLRVRGGLVEMQLGDGQMVRTPAENVQKRQQQPAPKTKSVAAAPENKQVKPGENKTERK